MLYTSYFFPSFSSAIDVYILEDILTGIAICVFNALTWCLGTAAEFREGVGSQASPGIRVSFQSHKAYRFPHI